ncbi:MAG: hypothetical protein IH593_09555, partial [Bacteroidales bacterium]|nr:hypothetical protein [Bacteroidales bacterium]
MKKKNSIQPFPFGEILMSLALVIFYPSLSAQLLLPTAEAADNSNYYVKYIAQFPAKEGDKTAGFLERLGNLILGGASVQLNKPVNIIAYNPASFWVLDQGNGSLLKNNGGTLSVPKALRKNKTIMSSLVGITSTGGDGVLFTDSRDNKIYHLSAGGTVLNVFNTTVSLDQPTGIACSPVSGEIWVAETGSHRIAVLNRNGELVRRIGKRGSAGGEFNFPTFICIDSSGLVYIVDAMNFRIQILDAAGKYISSFGKQGHATGYFARPKGIAVDSRGNIYVADALLNAVQIFDSEGNFLYYFGSQGRSAEQFWMPSGM